LKTKIALTIFTSTRICYALVKFQAHNMVKTIVRLILMIKILMTQMKTLTTKKM